MESHTAGNPRTVMRGGMAAVGLFRLTLVPGQLVVTGRKIPHLTARGRIPSRTRGSVRYPHLLEVEAVSNQRGAGLASDKSLQNPR